MNIYDIHCFTAGEGDAVLILHPFRRDGFAGNTLVEQLSKQFRVYSITLPGFGEEREDLPGSMEEYIEFLKKFVETKYLDSFILIGISLGASVALNYSVLYPDRLVKMVLVNPLGLRDVSRLIRGPFKGILRQYLIGRFSGKDRCIRFLNRFMVSKKRSLGPFLPMEGFKKKSQWPGQAAQAILILGRHSKAVNRRLHLIQKPVLIIGSRNDRLVPAGAVRLLEGMLQSVTLQWVDQAGHLGLIESPEPYFVKIEQFI